MMFRTIVGFLIVLVGCSGNQQTSKGELQIENGPNQHLGSKSGLLIDNGINRGTSYTDSLGTDYNLRYIPITITNDSTIPVHLQIAFSKEYDYPAAYGDEKFRVFLLPKEWADTITITNSMFDELKNYIDRPLLNETIEPGEKCVVAIGTLYSRPTNCGVLPNALFLQNKGDLYHECDGLINQDKSTNSQLALGLKLDLCGRCTLIPCGQISYPERLD
ncbi:hypothetical protein QQ008_22745 [Fulvivirgaceae bacterium BMA10]|uniref:Lipoprotein n=1 Tax=Splendidivirga corallicola TaxID=3051826 RepID=A0ABT8KX88_9BACT|nr:hypothetical protein [Fulvivirgaceae bacterium BMA10]